MSREIVVEIDERGDARLLYTEALPLREVGQLRVERASWVLWDEQEQSWFVRTAQGEVIGRGFASRDEAIAHENRVLQERMWEAACASAPARLDTRGNAW